MRVEAKRNTKIEMAEESEYDKEASSIATDGERIHESIRSNTDRSTEIEKKNKT